VAAIAPSSANQRASTAAELAGVVQLNGRRLIQVTIGITCVFALFVGPFAMAPELIACAAALWYPTARLTGLVRRS
jgi:hypothetical protein